MPIEPNATLTYNPSSKGWPSFYSYFPEFIRGMNSYLYTFNGGNIWRHNTNSTRNRFYGQQYNSTITGVLNQKPLEIKLYKTLSYESNTDIALYSSSVARWDAMALDTDLRVPGAGIVPVMTGDMFAEKEGEWFAYIRSLEDQVNWRLRSAHGLADSVTITGAGTAVCVITFATPPGYILSIGDVAYEMSAANNPIPIGSITAISNVVGAFSITVNNTVAGGSQINPTVGRLILYYKDSVAESYGARGYYLQFKLRSIATVPVELFAVSGSVMKSFP